MSDNPTLNTNSLVEFAAQLGEMLNHSAQRAKTLKRAEQYKELGVEWDANDTKIKLPGQPQPMQVRQAIQNLIDLEALESQEYVINEFLPGMPYDAAHAFVQVLKRRYGWVNPQTQKTFFGDHPPQMVTVRTGPKPEDYVQVPVGEFKLQDVSSKVRTGFDHAPDQKSGSFVSFYISAKLRYEDREVLNTIIAETRQYLAEHSIYKGRAMRLGVDSSGQVESQVAPSFIDLSKVDERGLVLTESNYALLNATVWTPIRKTAVARRHNVSLKRGALLFGPYGTGKTLTALVTAKIAQENGWTFIMVDDARGLTQALEMAKQYQPAVVFAEDIDRAVIKDRDHQANDILNTIDGALSKGAEVITVLTTNHIERINEAMLRPGRLDALIHVAKPDASAAERLVRLYGGDLLSADEPLDALGRLIAEEGYIPAIISEIVQRAKLVMIFREEQRLIQSDLLVAAEQMRDHSRLIQQPVKNPSVEERLGLAFRDLLGGETGGGYSGSQLEGDVDVAASLARDAREYASAAHRLVKTELPEIKELLERFGRDPKTQGVFGEINQKLDRILTNGARN